MKGKCYNKNCDVTNAELFGVWIPAGETVGMVTKTDTPKYVRLCQKCRDGFKIRGVGFLRL